MGTDIYRRSSERYRVVVAGGAVAIAGSWAMTRIGGVASVAVAIGILIMAVGVMRGRRPLVRVEASRVLINFATPIAVPFHTVASVEQLASNDLSLSLRSGAHVVIPASRLADADGAWLKKELRREVRIAQRIEQARLRTTTSHHSGAQVQNRPASPL